MRPINDKLALQILDAGQKEFMEKGFEKASLRTIATSLGVTTGAIYRYYKDKNALFQAIVKEPADALLTEYKRIQNEFASRTLDEELNSLSQTSKNGHDWMFCMIYDNFTAFKLIACCAGGTSYEHYIDQLVEVEVQASIILLEKMEQSGLRIRKMDNNLLHILANAMFSGMFETVRHDMPRENAQDYFEDLRAFYEAGWNTLLGL